MTKIQWNRDNASSEALPEDTPVKLQSFTNITDFVPELLQAREMYPEALPKRTDPEG